MITPAKFEDTMQEYEKQINNTDRIAEKDDIRRKSTEDVIFILKQYGFDAGTEIYRKILKK